MGDARDGLAERRHLLGLEQLVIDVAGFVVELLALADVPDERFDAQAAVLRRGSARPVTSTHTAVSSARRRRSR